MTIIYDAMVKLKKRILVGYFTVFESGLCLLFNASWYKKKKRVEFCKYNLFSCSHVTGKVKG